MSGANAMNTKLEKLISILEQIHAVYAAMLPLLKQEKKAALAGDAEKLNRQTVEKETLVNRLTDLENARAALVVALAEELHCSPEDLTTGYLAGRAGPSLGTRLDAVHAALRTLLFKVREINAENQAGINHVLKLVKSGLGFFEHITNGLPVYGASGGIDDSSARHGLVLSNTA